MEKYFEILRGSKLFYGVSELELKEMLHCLKPQIKSYQKGSFIFYRGDAASAMGLVASGSVHILKEDYWGNRTILAEVSAGQLFGEAYACSDRQELAVSAAAAQDCEVLFLDVKQIFTVCSSACVHHTRLIQNLVRALADKNISLTAKIEHMSQRRLRDKVLSYLSDISRQQGNADFFIPFNRQQLADYLSVDRSALSNELCKLRDEGLLRFEKNHFWLL